MTTIRPTPCVQYQSGRFVARLCGESVGVAATYADAERLARQALTNLVRFDDTARAAATGLDGKIRGICDSCRQPCHLTIDDEGSALCGICRHTLAEMRQALRGMQHTPAYCESPACVNESHWIAAARHPATMVAIARSGFAVATLVAPGTDRDGREITVARTPDGLVFDRQWAWSDLGRWRDGVHRWNDDVVIDLPDDTSALIDAAIWAALTEPSV